jgi:acyl-CoA synthetase (AMP-forming)/AMP-acid ligase II
VPDAATIRDAIEAHARTRPSAPFLLAPEPGKTVTYADLRATALGLAALLRGHGIAPGEVVSWMLPNGVAAAGVFLGAMYGGYVVSPISLLAQDALIEHALAHSRTRVVFAAEEHVDRLRAAAARVGSHATVRPTSPDDLALAHGQGPASAVPEPASPALLMYTSGTTGKPKGALLSHANLIHAGRAVAASHALTPADRVLSSLPLYHVNGQCIATVSPLVSGGSVVMPHRFSASQWWDWVERYRPTWLNLVPTIIAYLLHGAELSPAQREACRAIRFARSASAPLPPDQHRAFEARFGISVLEAMGLTECASVAFANPLDPRARKLGSPGRPCGVEARIVAPDGTVLREGERGEIELRGANVMLRYHDEPEATARALREGGWLATGDLGHRDRDGFYFVTGRLKELIIKGGENIAPREIDEALLLHPAVLEAAAVGIPDDEYGQEILACVVLKDGAVCDEAELRAHCLAQLGHYKTPKAFRFLAELPKGPSGKVQRLKLAEGAPSRVSRRP